MPYVNIRMTKKGNGATKEQKAQIVKEITETLVRVLGKDPKKTLIEISESDPEHWGNNGSLVSDS